MKKKEKKVSLEHDIKTESFMRGYKLGKSSNEKYAKLGEAIVDCLYEFFEPVKEDD